MISFQDFQQYYQHTYLKNKGKETIAEVQRVSPFTEDRDTAFMVDFLEYNAEGGIREKYSIEYTSDSSFWNQFEVINPPLGYIQHNAGLAVFLSMAPARQYLKSLSNHRIRVTIPNTDAASLCNLGVRRDEPHIIMQLFAPFAKYTQAYFDVVTGEKLGVCISKRLALCANILDPVPDLFYKREKIGTCGETQITLLPKMREYKEYVQEITQLEKVKCA